MKKILALLFLCFTLALNASETTCWTSINRSTTNKPLNSESYGWLRNVQGGGTALSSNQIYYPDKAIRLIKIDGVGIDNLYVFYPFVGGSASAHSFNLANSLYTITWGGTVTHNANGITGDGATGYGDTGLAQSVIGSTGGGCIYTTGNSTARATAFGVSDSTITPSVYFRYATERAGAFYDNGYFDASTIIDASYDFDGYTGVRGFQRIANNNIRIYKDGISVSSNSTSTTLAGSSAGHVNLLCRYRVSTADRVEFTDINIKTICLHKVLDTNQILALHTIIKNMEADLGRP